MIRNRTRLSRLFGTYVGILTKRIAQRNRAKTRTEPTAAAKRSR